MEAAAAASRPESIQHWIAGEVRAVMGRQKISGRGLAVMTGLNHTNLVRRVAGHVPFSFEELVLVTEALDMDLAVLAKAAREAGHTGR